MSIWRAWMIALAVLAGAVPLQGCSDCDERPRETYIV